MALVRDPEIAARYAADPSAVLADAHLAGVTIADVNNLIPVVTDSLAASTPGFGMAAGAGADPGNVWTSGAAAAAFDAFDIHIPAPDEVHQAAIVLPPADVPADRQGGDLPADQPEFDQPLEPAGSDWAVHDFPETAWQHDHVDPQSGEHQQGEHQPGEHQPGFDLL